jgi:DNA topoisomerase-1
VAKNLVIVESPSKGRTISRFLGSDFIVESSYGHIRDLPSSKLGVDTENNFEPQYVIPRKASAAVKKLKKLAASAEKTILATDEDREGEAIAWHLVQALGLNEELKKNKKLSSNTLNSKSLPAKRVERIVFHEITQKAITEALKIRAKLT